MTQPEITMAEVDALENLRRVAAANPIDISEIKRLLETDAGTREYTRRIETQQVLLKKNFQVVLLIETGHSLGVARHMTFSDIGVHHGFVPSREAVWMVAEHLGFVGDLDRCQIETEELESGGLSIDLLQPLHLSPQMGRA